MDDESKQMHVDSLNVQVFNHQSLKDSLPVIEHAGSSGKGFPYAPEDFPSPGDVWTWRVGKRHTHAGFWQDRTVCPPDRLQSSMDNKISFRGRPSLGEYIRKTFPDADVDAFFASFVWKIPCTNVAKESLKAIKSNGCSESAAIVQPGDCKASNEMCLIKAKTGSALTPATCNICCSEPNFCRNCCCILCSKTIDWIYDGYSVIKCEALVDEKFICGHVAHIECALRAYLAGKVGGSIDLDAQYYCRCCDNKTDLLLHVQKIIKVSESIGNRDDMVKVLNLGFCMLRGSEMERAEKLRNHIATSIERLKHGVLSEDIWRKRSEISELEQGSAMGRDSYEGFRRHGGGGGYKYRDYVRPRKTEEERRVRKDQEAREFQEEVERRAREREERHKQIRKDEDSRKRRSVSDRSEGREGDDHGKRPKTGGQSSSNAPTSKALISSVSVEISSTSPPLPKDDIQTIISRKPCTIPKAPTRLESRFPNWCLRGVRFDPDLTPIDKDAMYQSLDTAKKEIDTILDAANLEIDKLHNWQKLVDELQRVNHLNQEAMLTMENDKSEWDKVLNERDEEIRSLAARNESLEAQVKKLNDDLTTSAALHNQREALLNDQVKNAHAAQKNAECQLFAEQETVKSYSTDTVQLREKVNSQSLEIAMLQVRAERAERERDEAVEAHQKTRVEINSTLFEFYKHSILGRGSLAFLDSMYEITLAEVWEQIVVELGESGFSEDELIGDFLDEAARAALAKGKEQLAKERAEAGGIGSSGQTLISDPAPSAISTDAVTISTIVPSAPV